MKMLDAIKYFLLYSINWFLVTTFWAVVCVLGAAVVLGNGLPHWGISLWWIPLLVLVDTAFGAGRVGADQRIDHLDAAGYDGKVNH